jgi:hypothetical protein
MTGHNNIHALLHRNTIIEKKQNNVFLGEGVHHHVVFVQSMVLHLFSDEYNTINDGIFIYPSHSLRYVSAGKCNHRRVVLELYKREELGQGPFPYSHGTMQTA